ncbi:His-Xaa-Ser system radical SAM maturase HxsB [Sandaracinus amylolyticus]|uniref:Arylsulfatase regulator n=1 Tax=Sandaracinus amylolyticus TaxID=927083 RepID=A0A0F6VZ74_9BACT|nr:His-Xaa-Ser system radical SAM maturase HxsB [Sandaracinus amylolyticus]AKF03208.1 Arylsulfatase regulator [Sandaracinus amylolyticus]
MTDTLDSQLPPGAFPLRGLRPSATFPAFFRYRALPKQRVLLTNLEGNFLVLADAEFRAFVEGNVAPESELHARLREGNFLRAHYDTKRAADALRRRKSFVGYGPNLHMLVVTLRCNETCVYCHASRAAMDAVHTDMTPEIAEKCVDIALSSTSPGITIEFQGGEPLVNFAVVKHVIEYARKKNERLAASGEAKTLEFTMVSNLSLMDEEKLAFLLENRVQICTSIDGPQGLHDKQRKLPALKLADGTKTGGSSWEASVKWIRRINEEYAKLGLDTTLYRVEALLTTTRETLPLWKEVVDQYVDLGCRALFLRPLDPFGFAEKTGPRLEYPRAEYLDYYRKCVDYMVELNLKGVQVLERYAAIFLTKILSGEDPNFLDIRSPSGAGIGALAYNYDGSIFTCDEGRMLHETGDDTFLLGHVNDATYRGLVGHETVRAVVLAGNLDARPDCVNCAYQPYCGVAPSHSHKTQGTIFGRMRESSVCAVHKGIQDYLFEKIADADPGTMEVFRRWTTNRPRAHFIQGTSSSTLGADASRTP